MKIGLNWTGKLMAAALAATVAEKIADKVVESRRPPRPRYVEGIPHELQDRLTEVARAGDVARFFQILDAEGCPQDTEQRNILWRHFSS